MVGNAGMIGPAELLDFTDSQIIWSALCTRLVKAFPPGRWMAVNRAIDSLLHLQEAERGRILRQKTCSAKAIPRSLDPTLEKLGPCIQCEICFCQNGRISGLSLRPGQYRDYAVAATIESLAPVGWTCS